MLQQQQAIIYILYIFTFDWNELIIKYGKSNWPYKKHNRPGTYFLSSKFVEHMHEDYLKKYKLIEKSTKESYKIKTQINKILFRPKDDIILSLGLVGMELLGTLAVFKVNIIWLIKCISFRKDLGKKRRLKINFDY